LVQGVFFNLYTFFYLLSPKHCHAFVGYLEEEVGAFHSSVHKVWIHWFELMYVPHKTTVYVLKTF